MNGGVQGWWVNRKKGATERYRATEVGVSRDNQTRWSSLLGEDGRRYKRKWLEMVCKATVCPGCRERELQVPRHCYYRDVLGSVVLTLKCNWTKMAPVTATLLLT